MCENTSPKAESSSPGHTHPLPTHGAQGELGLRCVPCSSGHLSWQTQGWFWMVKCADKAGGLEAASHF